MLRIANHKLEIENLKFSFFNAVLPVDTSCRDSRKRHLRAAIFLAASCALVAAQWPLSALFKLNARKNGTDESRIISRLRRIRPFLPARGNVGYYCDPSRCTLMAEFPEKRLRMAQFELCPVRVHASIEHSLVICDSDDPKFIPSWVDENCSLVASYSDGISLYHKRLATISRW
jgi:hypothetical protein